MKDIPGLGAVATPYKHFPNADTAAVITIAADAEQFHVVDAVQWSFDRTPAAARSLTIAFDGTAEFHIEITSAGPGFFKFPGGLYTGRGEACVITLEADDAGAIGKINAQVR